ncbi:MAG TPA: hypothetical protein VKH44_14640 [Pirellulaceae bacterium]|nr:hypothetical protein [Pirellulaceae bacterium]
MTLEAFREALNAEPFQTFTIHTADGRSIPVVSREFIMRDPPGRTVHVYQQDGRLSTIDLLLVTELEKRPNGEAGAKRRRRN